MTHSKIEHGSQPRFTKVFMLLCAAAIVAGVYFLFFKNELPNVDRSAWQAVFLNNNQVYFGHLRNRGGEYVVLENIFYFRANQPLEQGASDVPVPGLNLVKLGGELHGPEDRMFISKASVLFWENLKEDSPVVEGIKSYNASQTEQ